jgi:hypothetical protein
MGYEQWVGHIAHIGGIENVHQILIISSEGKRPIKAPMSRWNNIKINWKKFEINVLPEFNWHKIQSNNGCL